MGSDLSRGPSLGCLGPPALESRLLRMLKTFLPFYAQVRRQPFVLPMELEVALGGFRVTSLGCLVDTAGSGFWVMEEWQEVCWENFWEAMLWVSVATNG